MPRPWQWLWLYMSMPIDKVRLYRKQTTFLDHCFHFQPLASNLSKAKVQNSLISFPTQMPYWDYCHNFINKRRLVTTAYSGADVTANSGLFSVIMQVLRKHAWRRRCSSWHFWQTLSKFPPPDGNAEICLVSIKHLRSRSLNSVMGSDHYS